MDTSALHFTVSLNTAEYRSALYWNFFCKNKRSTMILLFLSGCGFFTISYSLLLYRSRPTMFLVTLTPALICALLPAVYVWRLERQVRQKQREGMEKATEKSVAITAQGISVQLPGAAALLSCTWNAVPGVYRTGFGLMLYLDNGQIVVMPERHHASDVLEAVCKLAGQNQKMKKGFSGRVVLLLFAAVYCFGLFLVARV